MMNTINLNGEPSLHAQIVDHLNLLASKQDLANTLCLIPNDYLIYNIKQALIESGFSGLMPTITTVKEWLNTNTESNQPVLPQHHALLLLSDLLKQHQYLYGQGSAWGLASNLLTLFNELTLQGHNAHMEWDDFYALICTQASPKTLSHDWLQKEARIVHTLWQAWHTQMQDDGWLDFSSAYTQQLRAHAQLSHAYTHIIYIVPFKETSCEYQWLKKLSQTYKVTRFEYPTHHQHATTVERPIAECYSTEQHAQIIAGSAQRAFAQGVKTTIVLEDRKLSRRVQALLHRNNIKVDDKSGWALSTTTVGACIEHWLMCIETKFAQEHLLDVLKSNCVDLNDTLAPYDLSQKACVYHFEKDVIRHENISSQITRYQQALNRRAELLGGTLSQTYHAIHTLLDQCTTAATPLSTLFESKRTAPLNVYIEALLNSLEHLGMGLTLHNDAAGEVVLKLLTDSTDSQLTEFLPDISWHSFRSWLNQALEKTYFRPPVLDRCVTMVTYAQAYLMESDFYILCGVDEKTLPLKQTTLPFFSYATQLDLGLESQTDFEQRQHQIFNRLLYAHTPCLLTWQSQNEEEHIGLCRWLLQDQADNRITLTPERLASEDIKQDAQTLPELEPYTKPSISNIGDVLPNTISASAHQKLINSPYDFFVAYLLGLQSEEDVSDALKKSDYGSRVHRCLELFHQGLLTGEYGFELNTQSKKQATEKLKQIGQKQFFHDIAHYFENNAWFELWKQTIPVYLDWQLKNQALWKVRKTEHPVLHALTPDLNIKGRIDRIDQAKGKDNIALLDYKTGTLPSKIDMDTGEHVQLTTYALSESNVSSLSYIKLDKKITHVSQDEKKIDNLNIIEKVKERLISLHQALSEGNAIITTHCDHPGQTCHHRGICRCDYWQKS